jgi:hydroxymethylpyrimidine pyrophosphatase-like HAD family hydrolase
MESLGLTAKVSSIHVNGWLGAFDKLTTTREFCREFWGINIDKRKDEFIFIGDSPNDQPMFEYFPMAVGVANIFDYGDLISTPPKFATRERSGLGFAEVVNHLIGTDSASIVRLQGR